MYIHVLSPAYIYISHHAEVKSQLFQFIWLGSSWKSIFVLLNFENGATKWKTYKVAGRKNELKTSTLWE